MSAEHAPQHKSPETVTQPEAHETTERHKEGETLTHAEKHHQSPEKARAEVEQALSKETPTHEHDQAPKEAHAAPIITPARKAKAFQETMTEVRRDMSPTARTFSKFIHNRAVEDASEVTGKTIARPTSILLGSAFAFATMLVVYLLAKHNGFQLSGSEFILVFIGGWVLGLFVDFFRHMITGK